MSVINATSQEHRDLAAISRPPLPRDRPRVLHVITGMQIGGAEKVTAQLAATYGPNAAIAWLTGPLAWEEPLARTGVACHPLGMQNAFDLIQAVRQLRDILRKTRPDVVHTHLIHAHVVGRWAARLSGTKTVVSTEHNLGYHGKIARWLVPMDVRTSRNNRAVVAVSEAVRDRRLALGYRSDRLHIIYNGVAIPDVPPSPPDVHPPTLTMVGRLHPDKGADLFIETLERIPSVFGVLAGDGRQREEIRRRLASTRIHERVRWDSGANAAEALSKASLVIVPSRREGLGLVALEAMALSRPVLAARVGGLAEVVEDGVTGRLVSPESAEAFADAARAMLCHPQRLITMGLAGRRRVEDCFRLSTMLEKYHALYLQMIEQNEVDSA